LGLAICLSLFGDLTLYAVLPGQRENVGLSLAAVGVMLGVNRLIRIPGNPLAGALYDRVGRRRLFLLGMVLGTLSTLGYGLVTGFIPFLIARLTWGLAWTLLNVGGMSIIQDITTRANRGRVIGLYNVWKLAGYAIGPLLGGILVDAVGFQTTMRLYGATTALGLIAALVALPETHHPAPRPERPSAAPHHHLAAFWRHHVAALRANPQILTVLLLYVIFQFTGGGIVLSTLNLLLERRFGAKLTLGAVSLGVASASGILAAFRSLVAGLTGPIAGRLSDRAAERSRTIAASLLCGIAGFALLGVARSPTAITAGIILSAVSAGAGMATITAAVGDATPQGEHGAVMGLYATVGDIGSAAGPFLAYALASRVALQGVYLLCALAFTLGLWMTRRLRA
jgi:MFS family permease